MINNEMVVRAPPAHSAATEREAMLERLDNLLVVPPDELERAAGDTGVHGQFSDASGDELMYSQQQVVQQPVQGQFDDASSDDDEIL